MAEQGTAKKLFNLIFNWCWDTTNNAFPPVRIFFLCGAVFFYFADVGIDLFAAYEHYHAWRKGSETARDYFIATLVFIIIPNLLINAVSLFLYAWAQCMLKRGTRKGYQLYEMKGDIPFQYVVSKERSRLVKLETKIMDYFRRVCKKKRDNYSTRCQQVSNESNIVLHSIANPHATDNDDDDETGALNSNSPAEEETRFGSGVEEVDGPKSHDERRPNTSTPLLDGAHNDNVLDVESRGREGLNVSSTSCVGAEETDRVPQPLDQFTRTEFIFIIILHLLQLGFVFRVLRLLYYRRKDKLSFDRYKDVSFLRLMEGFFESAPQLLLQLYVITLEDIPDIERKVITGTAVVISMGSLALAIGDYISAEKDIEHYNPHDNKKMTRLSWGAYFLIIFAHLFMIISRGLSISLFATEYYLNVFIIGSLHYLLMVYWMYKQDTVHLIQEDNTEIVKHTSCCGRFGFEWLAAIFNIFFPFRLQKGSLAFIVSYYIVFFFENLLLILLWVVSVDYTQNLWYLEAAPITVVLSFLAGIALLLWYHFKCEPRLDNDEESYDYAPSSLEGSIMITSTLNRLYIKTE